MDCAASACSVSLLHRGNPTFTQIYYGYTIHTTLIGNFCFTACMLHSIYTTLYIPLAKKSLQEMWLCSQRDSGSSYHIKFSISETKLCCYEIMTEHRYLLRLYCSASCRSKRIIGLYFMQMMIFLPSVLCQAVSGMGAFLSCHSSVTLLWHQLDWIQTCKDFSSFGKMYLCSHWRTPHFPHVTQLYVTHLRVGWKQSGGVNYTFAHNHRLLG